MKSAIVTGLIAVVSLSACAPDPTQLASGLNTPVALTVGGDSLFWIENGGSATSVIRSIPTAGGKLTTVLAQAGLDGDLASDGTLLYFSMTASDSMSSVVASCGLDGSNVTTLTTALNTNLGQHTGPDATQMYVGNGTLWLTGQLVTSTGLGLTEVYSLPTTGGSPTVIPLPMDSIVTTLYWADASGAYFVAQEPATGSPPVVEVLNAVMSPGGAPVQLNTVPNPMSGQPDLAGAGAGVHEGSSFDFLLPTIASSTVALLSVPVTGGTVSTLSTYTDQSSGSLAGDSDGLFVNNITNSHNPGIFSVSVSSGVETQFVSVPLLSTTADNVRELTSDSSKLYWMAGGYNPGQGTIHAKAR